MKVFITMGIPGSGKSFFVNEVVSQHDAVPPRRGIEVVSPDRIRKMLTGDEGDQTQNSRVFDLAHGRLRWLLLTATQTGILLDPSDSTTPFSRPDSPPVIFDATNVQKFARQNLLDICAEFDAEPHLLVFDTPRQVCMERNRSRSRVVPDHAIKRMHGAFLEALDQIDSEGWASIIKTDTEWDEDHGVMTLTPHIA